MLPRVRARLRPAAPSLLAALPAIGVLVWWTADGGGYAPTTWYPGAIVLVGVLAAVGLGLRGRLRPSRPVWVALTALAAFTGWSYLSILWAGAEGVAFEGANRTLAYLACFALFAVLPWTRTAAYLALGVLVVAIGVVGVVTLAKLDASANPAAMFADGRLFAPLGYQNAPPALWTMAALPALFAASRRELPAGLRGALVALAGLLLQLAVLSQSRGWLFTLPLVLALMLVLCPGRVRLALFTLLAGAAAAISMPQLLDVYDLAGGQRASTVAPVIAREASEAARLIVATSLGLFVVGTLAALADRAVHAGPATVRRANLVAAAVGALALVGATGAGLAATGGDPVRKLDHAWENFKDYSPEAATGATTRYTAAGSSRYDFWRVSVAVAGDHPLLGVGQDNFAADYLLRRESPEEPRWTHSLPLRLLVHTGAVGLLLFAVFLGAVLWAALRGRRSHGDPRRVTIGAAALLPALPWLVHGSLDWFWELPALAGTALAGLGLAAGLGAQRREPALALAPPAPLPPWRRILLAAGAALAAVAALTLLALPWLSARNVDIAARTWGADPAGAFARLDTARSQDPLTPQPDLIGGSIGVLQGRLAVSRARFAAAAQRDPTGWFAFFEIGLIEGELRRPAASRSALLRARSLDPREPLIGLALRRLGTRRPLSTREANGELLERAARRLGR